MVLRKNVIESSTVVLFVTGKMKSGYFDDLEAELNKLSSERSVKLILDLQGIDAIDSTGVGLLVKARNDITESGGNMVLLASGRVQTIIKLSGLENYFRIGANQQEAIDLVKQPPPPKEPPAEAEPSSEGEPSGET